MRMSKDYNAADHAKIAQTKAAAFIAAQRREHTTETLAAQRQRINRWVKLWSTDKQYRACVIEKALVLQTGIAFRQTVTW